MEVEGSYRGRRSRKGQRRRKKEPFPVKEPAREGDKRKEAPWRCNVISWPSALTTVTSLPETMSSPP